MQAIMTLRRQFTLENWFYVALAHRLMGILAEAVSQSTNVRFWQALGSLESA
jgi:hypothetical protein